MCGRTSQDSGGEFQASEYRTRGNRFPEKSNRLKKGLVKQKNRKVSLVFSKSTGEKPHQKKSQPAKRIWEGGKMKKKGRDAEEK